MYSISEIGFSTFAMTLPELDDGRANAVFGGAVDIGLWDQSSFFLRYDGEVGDGFDAHSVRLAFAQFGDALILRATSSTPSPASRMRDTFRSHNPNRAHATGRRDNMYAFCPGSDAPAPRRPGRAQVPKSQPCRATSAEYGS